MKLFLVIRVLFSAGFLFLIKSYNACFDPLTVDEFLVIAQS